MLLRQTAKKVTIADIVSGEWVKKEGMEPSYVITPKNEQVSRARIMGTVVGKFASEDGNFASITIDDTTSTMRCKLWRETELLNGVELGQLVDVIGKVREYEGDIYLVPEVVKHIQDPDREILRRLEIISKSRQPQPAVPPRASQPGPSPQPPPAPVKPEEKPAPAPGKQAQSQQPAAEDQKPRDPFQPDLPDSRREQIAPKPAKPAQPVEPVPEQPAASEPSEQPGPSPQPPPAPVKPEEKPAPAPGKQAQSQQPAAEDQKSRDPKQEGKGDDKKEPDVRKKTMEAIEANPDGIKYADLIRKVGVPEDQIEPIINELLGEGICYEPTPGKIKKI